MAKVPVELAGQQQLFEDRFERGLGKLACDRSSERVGRRVGAGGGLGFFEEEVELAPVGELTQRVAEGGLLELDGGSAFEGGEDRFGGERGVVVAQHQVAGEAIGAGARAAAGRSAGGSGVWVCAGGRGGGGGGRGGGGVVGREGEAGAPAAAQTEHTQKPPHGHTREL